MKETIMCIVILFMSICSTWAGGNESILITHIGASDKPFWPIYIDKQGNKCPLPNRTIYTYRVDSTSFVGILEYFKAYCNMETSNWESKHECFVCFKISYKNENKVVQYHYLQTEKESKLYFLSLLEILNKYIGDDEAQNLSERIKVSIINRLEYIKE